MNPTIPNLEISEATEEQLRERAYFLWLEHGSPHGEDWAHWFAAKQQLLAALAGTGAESLTRAQDAAPHHTILQTLAAHTTDPTHRFHVIATVHDNRVDVVAGEARQRVRGRHFDGSLRTRPKKKR